jgi:hypothetical protein
VQMIQFLGWNLKWHDYDLSDTISG